MAKVPLMTPTPARLSLLSLCIVLVAAGWFGLHPRRAAAHPHRAAPTLRGTEVFPRGMEPALPFSLRDQNHRLVTLNSLRGQLSAVTFLDSHCTTQCPVVGRELAQVQRRLGRTSPLVTVVISVNPQDTPASARAFIRESGLGGTWHWLMGTRRQLAPVWRAYGIVVRPSPTDIIHTAAVYLVDRHLSVRVADAVPLLPWQFIQSVRALAAGH